MTEYIITGEEIYRLLKGKKSDGEVLAYWEKDEIIAKIHSRPYHTACGDNCKGECSGEVTGTSFCPQSKQFTEDELEDLFLIVDANIERHGKDTKTMKLLEKIEYLRRVKE